MRTCIRELIFPCLECTANISGLTNTKNFFTETVIIRMRF